MIQLTLLKFFKLYAFTLGLALAIGFASLGPGSAAAQESEKSSVSIGLDGIIRLGKWSPVFIQYGGVGEPAKFEIEVLDGDDTPLVFSGQLKMTESGDTQAWVRLGRKYGTIALRLFDKDDQLLEESTFPVGGQDKVGTAYKSTQNLIVTLEPETTFRSAIESSSGIGDRTNPPLIAVLDSKDEMPSHWLGYESTETMLLVTSDIERVEQFSKDQIAAIQAWVENGGRLVLSVSQHSEKLLSPGGLLEPFSPGAFVEIGKTLKSNRLEAYVDSDEQLIALRGEPIPISKFSEIDGTVVVQDSKKNPLVIRYPLGLGEVVFVTFDLDSERITNWESFASLISNLVSAPKAIGQGQSGQQSVKGTSVSTFGYDDLVGQLRVPLDRFSKVKFVAFTWIALLIGLYILCIGPGDFFFLKRLLGKMEMTWITFPLLALLFCGLAYGISKMTRPNSIQLNQLELIDIDTVNNKARGSVWSNLYSPHGGTCKIEFDANHNLGFGLDSELISWHGLPGDGLGGMWSSQTPGLMKTAYRQTVEIQPNQELDSAIVDLPLQVSSTKPMFGQWWSNNPIKVRSDLDSKSGRLSGTIKNPFDFRLKNCKVLYDNWAYELSGPLEASVIFDLQTETKEKTLRGVLTRRFKKSKDSNRSNNTAWDPTDTRIDRIAMMLMFYQAAGGSNYTGLTNDYQSFVDMTDNLLPNRAILIGQIDKPGVELLIDGERASEKYDETVTMVRVLLPVTVK